MKIDLQAGEDAAVTPFIRGLKVLPPDIRAGLDRLIQTETAATAQNVLATMATNTQVAVEMMPKGSGSENNSFLKMAIPAGGIDAIKTFVIDCVLAAGGKTCRRPSSVSGWAARPT